MEVAEKLDSICNGNDVGGVVSTDVNHVSKNTGAENNESSPDNSAAENHDEIADVINSNEVSSTTSNNNKDDDINKNDDDVDKDDNIHKNDDINEDDDDEINKDNNLDKDDNIDKDDDVSKDDTINKETDSTEDASTVDNGASTVDNGATNENGNKEDSFNKNDDEDIVELPVIKDPAPLVDLVDDQDVEVKNDPESQESIEMKSIETNTENVTSNGITIKLKSFATLANNVDKSCESVKLAPEVAIGDIVEHHGDYVAADESGQMHLKISNVVGGEDCITGVLTEDEELFPAIQITSVSSLIDPISPDNSVEAGDLFQNNEETKPEEQSSNAVETEASSDSLRTIRISSSVTDTETDSVGNKKSTVTIVNILHNSLVVPRNCTSCLKNVICKFKVAMSKKIGSSTYPVMSRAYLCSESCRTQWVSLLPQDYLLVKPRIFFERVCGMCGRELQGFTRDNVYTWETREFCNKLCLADHICEVAKSCFQCSKFVRVLYMGKYCVRFGSDIHQFCSNKCLEAHKVQIKVCCFCQKSLYSLKRIISPLNKEYCSHKCMKRSQRRDINQHEYKEVQRCTVCQKSQINKYDFIFKEKSNLLCSEPCLNTFKYANSTKAVNCCVCTRMLSAEDVTNFIYCQGQQLRVFCTDSCLNVFILSIRKIVSCSYCKVKKYNFDMISKVTPSVSNKESFYCSVCCLGIIEGSTTSNRETNDDTTQSPKNAVEPNTSSATESSLETVPSTSITPVADKGRSQHITLVNCNMCNLKAPALYHMVMSDNTLRNFCSYPCATKFKNTYGFQVSAGCNPPIPALQPTPQIPTMTESEATNPVSIRPKSIFVPNTKQKDDQANKLASLKQKDNQSTSKSSNSSTLNKNVLLNPTMISNLLKIMKTPSVANKSVMCKPNDTEDQTSDNEAEEGDKTKKSSETPAIIPVPIPVYVPTPMMMYNIPCPVPVVVPLPIPVPVFIPTTKNTTEDVFKYLEEIKEKPSMLYEDEVLKLAENIEDDELRNKEGSKDNVEEPEEMDEEYIEQELNILLSFEDQLPKHKLRLAEEIQPTIPTESFDSPSEKDKAETTDPSDSETRGVKRSLPTEDENKELEAPSKKVKESEKEDDDAEGGDDKSPAQLNSTYGLLAWKHWVRRKNEELNGVSSDRTMKLFKEDLLSMNSDELNNSLCLFLRDLCKPNGEEYECDTIYYLLLGLQQYLFENTKNHCIFLELSFDKFTNALDECIKKFVDQITASLLNRASEEPTTRITEEMLWECRQLGAHTPHVLLNTLFYFNTKVFKLKTVEEHAALSFVQIVKQWRRANMGKEGSVNRTTLLKYYPKKSQREESKDGDRPYEMHENRANPLRCPVKLYEFYLSKCPEKVRTQRDTYYVYPERSCLPNSPVWYSASSLQLPFLQKMLNRVLIVKEVQEVLHS